MGVSGSGCVAGSAADRSGVEVEGSLRAARLRRFAVRASRAYVDETRIDLPKLAGTMFSRVLPQLSFNRIRTAFLRAMGLRIGARSLVMGPLDLTGVGSLKDISIGDDSYITGPMRIDTGAPVHLGNRVDVGQDVLLLTVDHEIGPSEHRCGGRVTGEIVIEDGVWIGSRVTILPGTVIGKGAVVAAGSVVTADVPSNKLVAGAPARVVRDLDDQSPASTRRRRLAPLPP